VLGLHGRLQVAVDRRLAGGGLGGGLGGDLDLAGLGGLEVGQGLFPRDGFDRVDAVGPGGEGAQEHDEAAVIYAVYITAGPTEQSWKIVTTSLCSPTLPFMTPWIDWYNTGTSSITPRIEVLRTDSTTALTDAQIHGEWTARVTSGSVVSTWYSDQAQGATGTAQATGVGTGSWTGAGGTAWSGKLEPPSAITPAAACRLRGRIVVEAASTTVYADQLIRV
jgi:hypothetical protein